MTLTPQQLDDLERSVSLKGTTVLNASVACQVIRMAKAALVLRDGVINSMELQRRQGGQRQSFYSLDEAFRRADEIISGKPG